MNDIMRSEFEDALLSLDRVKIESIFTQKSSSIEFISLLEKMVVPAMESIGKKWENDEVALSQIYMSGKLCEEIINKQIQKTNIKRENNPEMAIVVYKDFHMLGKRIVYSLLKSCGYEVHDYGQEGSDKNLIKKIKKDKIQILLISVLMLNSALDIKKLTEKIKKENLKIKVVVGGAPFRFDSNLYKDIGADEYATNASDIIKIIDNLKSQL